MRKILIVTGTRAEYGLLYWTMKRIKDDNGLKLQLIVTGNHLVPDFGYTVDSIRKDGFDIDEEIDMIVDSNKKSGIVKSMGLELIQMAQAFDRLQPDILLILGDRYEIFVAAACAMMMNVPIAHMNGGESTEGAVDEQIRHAITKMANIHFAGAEHYKDVLLKMGEERWRVYNVGQAGIENIRRLHLLTKEELERELGLRFRKSVFLITYHPVTLEIETIGDQVENLLKSIRHFDAQYLFTYPNADFGNQVIIDRITHFVNHNTDAFLFHSLGQTKYLSLLKYSDVMIGNSSSGIIESPLFKVPVVNIGSRQKGRIRSQNIIDTGYKEEEIENGIRKALFDEGFRKNLDRTVNVFGDGTTSEKVVHILKKVALDKRLLIKKLSY